MSAPKQLKEFTSDEVAKVRSGRSFLVDDAAAGAGLARLAMSVPGWLVDPFLDLLACKLLLMLRVLVPAQQVRRPRTCSSPSSPNE